MYLRASRLGRLQQVVLERFVRETADLALRYPSKTPATTSSKP
jgi:hypothetical protein